MATRSAPYGSKPAVILSNDDGITPGSALVLQLARALVRHDLDVVVCAPGRNNSACGQAVTIDKPMTLARHLDYEAEFGDPGCPGRLRVFSLREGTPTDCVLAAVEPYNGLLARLGLCPRLVVSGVNLGPNLGSDVLYSGTFAAARQAAMCGVPAIATSLSTMDLGPDNPHHDENCSRAIDATVEVVLAALDVLPETLPDPGRLRPSVLKSDEMPLANVSGNGFSGDDDKSSVYNSQFLRRAFAVGDVIVNVNIPAGWSGRFESTRLDCIMYRNAVQMTDIPTGAEKEDEGAVVCLRAEKIEYSRAPGSDTAVVLDTENASVTTLGTWPMTHPLAIPPRVLGDSLRSGLPSWLVAASRTGLESERR